MRSYTVALALAAGAFSLAGCGGSGAPSAARTVASRAPAGTSAETPSSATAPSTATRPAAAKPPPPPPPHIQLLAAGTRAGPTPFVPAIRWRDRTAVWIARASSGVTLLSFDQHLLELHLHSGTIDAGAAGWRYGPAVGGAELGRLVAAFNGGFRFSVGAGGFVSYGRVGAPLRDGAGSIVTYSDGSTDIGSWHHGVPAAGKRVVSVRQNLTLLIDQGSVSSTSGCVSCWGATLGGVLDPARSALGITADGHLIWAAGEHLTVDELAAALHGARVARAVELDINPEWVAGYLYAHPRGGRPPVPVPALSAQQGIPGEFLSPWSRDFFTLTAR